MMAGKVPCYVRAHTTARQNGPLAEQKGFKRQVLKLLKHFWLVEMLSHNFTVQYGRELRAVSDLLISLLGEYPGNPESTGEAETFEMGDEVKL